MEITWLGHSSFRLRGKEAAVVTDPFDASIGLKLPKVEADIVTVSHGHDDHNKSELVRTSGGAPTLVIDSPGEYEIKGVSVFGVSTFHDDQLGAERGKNTVFVIEIDGVKVCHLGDLGHKLTESQMGEISTVDILLVPVGGFYTIGPKEAVEVVGQLEPRIVVPMHYKIEGMSATFDKLSGVNDFLKEMGMEKFVQPKLIISADKLPDEKQVMVLERKS